jgi:endonuclease/exonuclease/phosphatase (EEP) superfamily protein YafD
MTSARRAWPRLLGLSLVPFAVWTAVRLLGSEHGAPSVQLMAFTPYVAGAAVLPLAAALASRRWRHAIIAGALVAVLGGCVLPRTLADGGHGATATGPPVRMISANLLVGAADPEAVVALVREQRADVLALQELTPSEARALEAAGLTALLPQRVVQALDGSGGSALYSRYPLDDPGVRILPAGHSQTYATMRVPGARPVLVESVHPAAPSDDRSARQWAREISLEPAATPSGPVRILIGDFNSTLDHEGLRRLIATGYRDAAEVTGTGLEPTWPFNGVRILGQPVPPVTIDHVLADPRVGVRTVEVHPLPGSDHRAIQADLTLPVAAAT